MGECVIYIAHRGNIDGPNPSRENDPVYIDEALKLGYDVEVDVWFDRDHGWWLGHDAPVYNITEEFLVTPNLWLHCKNYKALYRMSQRTDFHPLHYFWHQNDDYTLTSKNVIWCYPGIDISLEYKNNAVIVMPEISLHDTTGYGAVCSDYVESMKND